MADGFSDDYSDLNDAAKGIGKNVTEGISVGMVAGEAIDDLRSAADKVADAVSGFLRAAEPHREGDRVLCGSARSG